MSVTTRTGDDGKSRFFGKVVDKDSELLAVVGEIDELTAVVAVVGTQVKGVGKITDAINTTLYYLSGYLVGYSKKLDLSKEIELIENDILRMEKEMEPVSEFLKAGKQLNVWWNWARVVARRTERIMVGFMKHDTRFKNRTKEKKEILVFMNRLSDYLFTLARRAETPLSAKGGHLPCLPAGRP